MRGKFLTLPVLLLVGLLLAGCTRATPQVIEKQVTVVVEKEKLVTVPVEVLIEVTREVTREVEKAVEVVTATPTPAQTPEPVTIVWWTDPLFSAPPRCPTCQNPGDYERMVADDYTRERPWITVEIKVLDWAELATQAPAAIAAGDPPDIMKDYLGRSAIYGQQAGVLVPLEDLLPPAVMEDIVPGLRETYTIHGHLHALPAYFWTEQLLYNRALIERAGAIMPATEDWTPQQMLDLLRTVKAAGIGVEYGFGMPVAGEQGDYAALALLSSFGALIWKEDCSGLDLDNPEALAGMEFIRMLHQEQLLNPDAGTAGWEDVKEHFYSGKTVLMGGGLYTQQVEIPLAQQAGKVTAELDVQQTLYPHAAGRPIAGPIVGPTGFFIFEKEARSQDELQEIVTFLLHINGEKWVRDAALNSRQFPALRSAGVPFAGDPRYEEVAGWVQEYGVTTLGLQCPHYAEVREIMPAYFQAMLRGEMSPQEALAGMMEQAGEIGAR